MRRGRGGSQESLCDHHRAGYCNRQLRCETTERNKSISKKGLELSPEGEKAGVFIHHSLSVIG